MIVLLPVLVLLIVIFCLGTFRSFQVKQSPKQKIFLHGTFPDPLPNGDYNGSVVGYTVPWKGKSFTKETQKGINFFKDSKRAYPFITYKGKGIQDPSIPVLKIDYNIAENPIWIRMILDEIVQIAPQTYLGKVHIRLSTFFHITIGYFQLKK